VASNVLNVRFTACHNIARCAKIPGEQGSGGARRMKHRRGDYALTVTATTAVTAPAANDRGESLRERKKAATRLALHEAALRLAIERGYADVTVEAIADAADVSRRTFSNYFANKEDALLYGDRRRSAELVENLSRRPAAESPWEALRASALELYRSEPWPDPDWLAQMRLLRQHPALVTEQAGFLTRLEQELADQLARRTGGPEPLTALIMSACFLAAIRSAINYWIAHPTRRPLSDLVRDALDRVADITRTPTAAP
jgi:AcrR family transcriptional regulator